MQVKTKYSYMQVVVAFRFATAQIEGVIGGLGGLQMPDAVEGTNSNRIGFVKPFVRAGRIFFGRPRTADNHIDFGSHINRGIVEVQLIEIASIGETQGIAVKTTGAVVPYRKEVGMVRRNGLHHERTVGAYHVAGGAVYPLITMYVLRNFGNTHFHIGNFTDIGISRRFYQDTVSHHNRHGVGKVARTS